MSGLNFKPDLAAMVMAGEKTVTRRLVSEKPNSPWSLERAPKLVGRDRAVCLGRGKGPQIGRVLITSVRLERLGRLSVEEARREGFEDAAGFEKAFEAINGDYDPDVLVWRVEFERVDTPASEAAASTVAAAAQGQED